MQPLVVKKAPADDYEEELEWRISDRKNGTSRTEDDGCELSDSNGRLFVSFSETARLGRFR